MKQNRLELLFILFILIFCFIVLFQAINFPWLYGQVPLVIGAITTGLCFFRIYSLFKKRYKGSQFDQDKRVQKISATKINLIQGSKKHRILLITMAGVIVYPLLVYILGIIIGTAVFLILFMYLMGVRSWKQIVFVPLIVNLLIYFIFIRLLKVYFPPGVFK